MTSAVSSFIDISLPPHPPSISLSFCATCTAKEDRPLLFPRRLLFFSSSGKTRTRRQTLNASFQLSFYLGRATGATAQLLLSDKNSFEICYWAAFFSYSIRSSVLAFSIKFHSHGVQWAERIFLFFLTGPSTQLALPLYK